MSNIEPFYTPEGVTPSFKLTWSFDVFWESAPRDTAWLDILSHQTEPDGVRIIEHHFRQANVSQFLVSTRPNVAPPAIARSIKGRLQHLLRAELPKAFHRNYAIRSVGGPDERAVRSYIKKQFDHHPLADPRFDELLRNLQISEPRHDLAVRRSSGHAQFWYNLHIVLVNDGGWREGRHDVLKKMRDGVLRVSTKKNHLLAEAAILPDHLHLALGCPLEDSPEQVSLCYMNNVSWTLGGVAVFRPGYYAGTFGEYDLGAVRAVLKSSV